MKCVGVRLRHHLKKTKNINVSKRNRGKKTIVKEKWFNISCSLKIKMIKSTITIFNLIFFY